MLANLKRNGQLSFNRRHEITEIFPKDQSWDGVQNYALSRV